MKHVIALHRVPDEGPETWTVTCAGCQTLMGMNQHGVTVGTTNLKTKGARVGIPYLSVLHKALKQTSRDLARAKHCLFDPHVAVEAELSESTHARKDRMQAILEGSKQHTVDSLIHAFADRTDGRLSISRFAEDNSGATTNAVVVCDPANLDFRACRGPADEGDWEKLEFERQPSDAMA